MSWLKDLGKAALGLIPAAVGFIGQKVGIKPTDVRIKHIGPAHDYDTFGACYRCNRFDLKRQLYTQPPCPRTYSRQET
jgi:hypothetical protein